MSGSSGAVSANTIGSTYDTTLSVWTGTPGSLISVACNDDIADGQYTQSQLSFTATAGTKYYFMVAPFGPPETGSDLLGGKTVLNVSNANISSLSASPSSQTVSAGSLSDVCDYKYGKYCLYAELYRITYGRDMRRVVRGRKFDGIAGRDHNFTHNKWDAFRR